MKRKKEMKLFEIAPGGKVSAPISTVADLGKTAIATTALTQMTGAALLALQK